MAEPFLSLLLALFAGLLIGLEREQSARIDAEGQSDILGGARTHPLVAVSGACAMLLAKPLGPAVLLVIMAGFLTFLALSYAHDLRTSGSRGLTSEVALLLTFLLGALSAADPAQLPLRQKIMLVSSVSVVVTLLLSVKPRLHALVHKASKEDILATLKFLLVALVLVPQLPDQAMGPLDVLNPYKIGLMVVLIAGIGFTGYVAIRVLGTHQGLGLTGLLGGLVSSTAVTLSLSGRAKAEPRLQDSFAMAIVLASSVMFLRVLVTVAILAPALVRPLAIPIGAMAAGGFIASGLLWRHSQKKSSVEAGEIPFTNPFELATAFKFAAFFALVLLGAKGATTYFGTGATYLTGILAGTTDVDAITLSMTRLAQTGAIGAPVAVTTILLGVASNTLVKAGMSSFAGGWAFGRRIVLVFLSLLGLGGLGLLLVWRG
ncbi:MAG: MgtC/SapB family protein [Holophaga sp.]|nr:MgtC/SapB family protein [Holophaga sp.]